MMRELLQHVRGDLSRDIRHILYILTMCEGAETTYIDVEIEIEILKS